VSVVGRPIRVTKNPKPTLADLEEVQARYIDELARYYYNTLFSWKVGGELMMNL
jgi:hypothetical protein